MAHAQDPVGVSLFCPDCTQVIKDPRVLPCLHSLCKACIKKRPNGNFKCPVCSETTSITSPDDIEKLPLDGLLYSVLDMVALHSGHKLNCDVCDESERSSAVSRCKECAQYLCSLHSHAHKRAKITKMHNLSALKDLKKQPLKEIRRPLYCAIHSEEPLKLEYFCETCDTVICRSCTLDKHSEHAHCRVEEALVKFNAELEILIQKAKDSIKEIEVAIPIVETAIAEVHQRSKTVATEIEVIFDYQVTTLWKRKKELRDRVHELRKTRTNALKAQEESLKKSLKQLKHACKVAEINVKSNNNVRETKDGSSLILKNYLTSRLNFLITKEAGKLKPVEESELRFSCDDTLLRKAIEHLGRLDWSYVYPPQCVARGPGLRFAAVAEPANFVVVLADREGKPLQHNEPINIAITADDGRPIHVDSVTSRQEGTYEISYIAYQKEVITISVTVRGQEIKGSPFRVAVGNNLRKSWI